MWSNFISRQTSVAEDHKLDSFLESCICVEQMLPSPRCQSLTQKKKTDFERNDHTFLKMPLKFVSKCLSDVEASQLLKCAVQKQIQLPFPNQRNQ